nr:aspartate dehydrogenase [Variovorax boronicumulans]
MTQRIALIGFGAMGRSLARMLAAHADSVCCVAVLQRPGTSAGSGWPAGAERVETVAALLALQPDLVVECASHTALQQHGAGVLAAGTDLLVAAVGALADAALEQRLCTAAREGGAQVLVPAGALGALDILSAARLAGLARVDYLSHKPAHAWKGTPAEQLCALDALTAPTVFYEGTAREAALRFPQNANVAAAVALAGAGFEATRVRLMADPAAQGNRHVLHAEGAFGHFDFSVSGQVLPDNPKTSMLAPASLARCIFNRGAAIALA